MLVAISIPIFTNQLEKAREATDAANLRSAYAEAAVKQLDDTVTGSATIVTMKSSGAFDKSGSDPIMIGDQNLLDYTATKGGTVTVAVSDTGVTSFSGSGLKKS